MTAKMKMENLETLGSEDVLKFVVGTIEDLKETENVVKSLAEKKSDMPHLFISPVFGNLSNEEIVNWLLNSNIMVKNNVRFQVQLHKIIWDPERRGVWELSFSRGPHYIEQSVAYRNIFYKELQNIVIFLIFLNFCCIKVLTGG